MEQPPALTDFPKLYCPFLRQTFKVNVEQWKTSGAKIGLREPQAYLVVDRVAPGFEWVFDWFYSGQVEILGYDKKGRDEMEDQECFD